MQLLSSQTPSGGASAASKAARQVGRTNSGPATAARRELWKQVRDVGGKVRTLPKLASLGYLGLGLTAFELGWRIGTGINAKFLKVEQPAGPSGFDLPELRFMAAGDSVLFNGAPVPEDAWVLSWWKYAQRWSTVNTSDEYGGVCNSVDGPPPGFSILMGSSTVPWCLSPYTVESFYLPVNSLPALSGIEPYTGQSFDYISAAPEAPTDSELDTDLQTQLDDPSNAELRGFINYELGEAGASDPLGELPDNPNIEFPGYEEHFIDHAHEFAVEYRPLTDREYWEDAADLVERARNDAPGTDRCIRVDFDYAEVYWDDDTGAIVVVKDGKIVTYHVVSGGYDKFEEDCRRTS